MKDFIKRLIILPLYFVLKILRPFKLVRFGALHSDIIGHFAGNTEMYLCEKEQGIQPKDSLDIFYHATNTVSNHQLLKMWQRVLHINNIGRWFRNINLFPWGKEHKITTICSDRDVFGLIEKSKKHLWFTREETENAESELRKMGIKKEAIYICLANRDVVYKNTVNSDRDWSYHNYRNSNIQNYVLATEELSKREYNIIRMGSEVQEIMRTNNIIEYAKEGFRTELLDIYLSANCLFFINGESGLGGIPRIFRVPFVFVNLSAIEYILGWGSNTITITKKYWLKKEKRFMKFREILESGAGRYLQTQKFEKHGIELIENTPDEIRDVSLEMDERLKGTWQSNKEDEELQKRFWNLFKPSD